MMQTFRMWLENNNIDFDYVYQLYIDMHEGHDHKSSYYWSKSGGSLEKFKQLVMVELNKNAQQILTHNKPVVEIYRAMMVPGKTLEEVSEKINYNNIGQHWAFDINSAVVYRSNKISKNGTEIILYAEIKNEFIDWESSIAQQTYLEEGEAVVYYDSPILIKKILLPPEEPLPIGMTQRSIDVNKIGKT